MPEKDKFKLSDELIAGYVEGLLPDKDKRLLEEYLLRSPEDQEMLRVQREVARQQKEDGLMSAPEEITEIAKDLARPSWGEHVLDMAIRFSEDAFAVLKTSGEILRGPQGPLTDQVRGQNFPETKTILTQKVFGQYRVEVEISRENRECNTIVIRVVQKKTKKVVDGLQITLKKENRELESHPTLQGRVTFENVETGRYTIEIVEARKPLGLISLQLIKL